MSSFRILTDASCDLTDKQLADLNVARVQFQVHIPGSNITQVGMSEKEMKPFYERLRRGDTITTSAANVDTIKRAMEDILSRGEDVLYLGFDSELSSTYQNARLAALDLQASYPEQNIRTVDTLCGSLGLGLLVMLAAEKQRSGYDLEQTLHFVLRAAPKICHWFTVDDLHFLKRGGRLSAASATVAAILHIKPILHNNAEGRLLLEEKVKGRKRSMNALVERVRQGLIAPEKQRVMICHGDCLEDAKYIKRQLLESVGVRQVEIGYIGAALASHSGPGALAVFYVGNNR